MSTAVSSPVRSSPVREPTSDGLTLVSVKDGLWRVTNRSGAVIGHIERHFDTAGDRFSARRVVAAARMPPLGSFWRIDDAADCFR